MRIPPGERIEEIGALATMIDENRYQYGLDALCKWRGLPGKDESLLHEGCTALDLTTKNRKKFKPQNCIHQLPARFVGPYAEADAFSTLALFEDLNPILDRENTRAIDHRMRSATMVLEMRLRSVRINVPLPKLSAVCCWSATPPSLNYRTNLAYRGMEELRATVAG